MSDVVGCSKWDLDTPALLVDLPTMESNIQRMADTFRAAGVGWRPHTKGIKVPAIAHRLLRAGAIGVTCAKLGEAEVMAAAGITEILIANQIVGPIKARRLAQLSRSANVIVAVDSIANVAELDAAACAAGTQIRVVVEVDTGMHRAGTSPGDATVALAREVAARPGLRFVGVMGWEGHTVGIKDAGAKREAISQAVSALVDTGNACRDAGLNVEVVSCGGTGSYKYTSAIAGVTEVQAGGGIFGDVYYRESMGVDHPFALTVLVTVTSRPTPQRIICDAGKKTMSSDSARPRPLLPAGVQATEVGLSAEHARIELDGFAEEPRVGDKIEFVVGYSDTTVFLHDELYALRDGCVEAVWPIQGRGKLR
jgi:D-serine deaminase-like pyridoxal phosphate-dependent protein